MNTLQIGSFILSGTLLLVLLFGFAGWLGLRLLMRNDNREKLLATVSNGFWIWLVVWKFSYPLFHFEEFLAVPLSALYFDGGVRGFWLAGLLTAGYAGYRLRKLGLGWKGAGEAFGVYLASGFTAYQVGAAVLDPFGPREHLVLAGLALVLLGAYAIWKREAARRDEGWLQSAARILKLRRNFVVAVTVLLLAAYSVYDHVADQPQDHVPGGQTGDPEVGIKPGQLAPDFALKDLEGKVVHLSEHAGKKVVLNFWASWCPPCRAEMPHLQAYHERYGEEGISLIGVNLSTLESGVSPVQAFVQDKGLTFPVLLDETGEVKAKYHVKAYPTTYVLDENGIVRAVHRGVLNGETLHRLLKKADALSRIK